MNVDIEYVKKLHKTYKKGQMSYKDYINNLRGIYEDGDIE